MTTTTSPELSPDSISTSGSSSTTASTLSEESPSQSYRVGILILLSLMNRRGPVAVHRVLDRVVALQDDVAASYAHLDRVVDLMNEMHRFRCDKSLAVDQRLGFTRFRASLEKIRRSKKKKKKRADSAPAAGVTDVDLLAQTKTAPPTKTARAADINAVAALAAESRLAEAVRRKFQRTFSSFEDEEDAVVRRFVECLVLLRGAEVAAPTGRVAPKKLERLLDARATAHEIHFFQKYLTEAQSGRGGASFSGGSAEKGELERRGSGKNGGSPGKAAAEKSGRKLGWFRGSGGGSGVAGKRKKSMRRTRSIVGIAAQKRCGRGDGRWMPARHSDSAVVVTTKTTTTMEKDEQEEEEVEVHVEPESGSGEMSVVSSDESGAEIKARQGDIIAAIKK